MKVTKYGHAPCDMCGTRGRLQPITAKQARARGYDAEYDDEYYVVRCEVCAGFVTVVYHEDIDLATVKF